MRFEIYGCRTSGSSASLAPLIPAVFYTFAAFASLSLRGSLKFNIS